MFPPLWLMNVQKEKEEEEDVGGQRGKHQTPKPSQRKRVEPPA